MTKKEKEKLFYQKAKSIEKHQGRCMQLDCENCYYHEFHRECFTFAVLDFCEKFIKTYKEDKQLELDFT